MSRPSNPYDNAKAESVMKTLKAEEVDGKTCADIEEPRCNIAAFIEYVYNVDRLHSAFDCKSPVVFEEELRNTEANNRILTVALSPN
jgi:putative transposase